MLARDMVGPATPSVGVVGAGGIEVWPSWVVAERAATAAVGACVASLRTLAPVTMVVDAAGSADVAADAADVAGCCVCLALRVAGCMVTAAAAVVLVGNVFPGCMAKVNVVVLLLVDVLASLATGSVAVTA